MPQLTRRQLSIAAHLKRAAYDNGLPKKGISIPVSFICIIMALICQFLLILSGSHSQQWPATTVYFLEADTTGMSTLHNPARWTYWSICSVNATGQNTNCDSLVPALPFSPAHRLNFNSALGLTDGLLDPRRRFFFLSRFAWAFYLLALMVSMVTGVTGVITLNMALRGMVGAAHTALCVVALVFQFAATVLMATWTQRARAALHVAGHLAHVGPMAYGLSFGATVALIVALITKGDSGAYGPPPTPPPSVPDAEQQQAPAAEQQQAPPA